MTTSIYIAAASCEFDRAERWARIIRGNSDLRLVSSWQDSARTWTGNDAYLPMSDQRNVAGRCYLEIARGRIFWFLFPQEPGFSAAFTELGIAISSGKKVVVSGVHSPRNIFTACGAFRSAGDDAAYDEVCRLACAATIPVPVPARSSDRPGGQ